MASRVHQELSVHLRRIIPEHQRRVNQRDSLESEGVRSAEGEELKVNLRELNVKFAEITDVVEENAFTEVALDKLVLDCVLL